MGEEFTQLQPLDFHATPGVGDWRVLFWGAQVFYATGSFEQGAEFVSAIAEVSSSVGHPPDVDLRPEGVTVRTASRPDGALSAKDAELAAAISEAAHALGLQPDPSRLMVIGVAVAQDTDADTRAFWKAITRYDHNGEEDLTDPLRRGPHLWFHELSDPRPGRGRTHIDVSVPADQAEQRVKEAIAAGGRVVDDTYAPKWWTLASPDNHGVDVAAWADSQT